MTKSKKAKKAKKSGKVAGAKGARLMELAQNPLVADVVAAALVATAAALKDSKRARALASDVGDELATLSKKGAKAGDALWEMALEIGRQSVGALSGKDASRKTKPKSKSEDRKGSSKKRTSAAKAK